VRRLAWPLLVLAAAAIVIAALFHPSLRRFRSDRAAPVDARGWDTAKAVVFVATPQRVVDRMLELAEVGKGDVVYDLGSGDGRIVITAARRYGVHAVGFEIDPELVQKSRDSIRKVGLRHLASIRDQDLFTADISHASVLTLYLLSQINLKLRPRILSEMRPGSRVISYRWDMGDWKPERTIIDGADTLYMWRVPGEK
jgi:trans-aconitate methyltransferase